MAMSIANRQYLIMNKLTPTLFYDLFHKKGLVQKKVIKNNNFTYRNTIEILNKEIGNTRNVKILDYGCGVGTVALYVASKGNRVLGVDVSPRAIMLAKKSAKILKLGNLVEFQVINERFRLKHKSEFDIAILTEVIEHVYDDDKMLSDICYSVKKDGKLILSAPSVNAPLYRLGLASEFDKKVGHLRRYDSIILIDKLEKSGFHVNGAKRVEGILRNSLFVISSFGKLIRFIRGPISDLVTIVDNLTIPIFGESNIYVIAQKI